MADEVTLPSVYEFQSDISTQEAPPPLPIKSYTAQCTAAAARQSKSNPDNVILDLEFTIMPDQFPADFTATSDPVKLHFNRIPINKDDARTRFQLRQLCEKMRVSAGRSLDVNDFAGKMAVLKVKHGSWQGLPRAEIDTIEAAS